MTYEDATTDLDVSAFENSPNLMAKELGLSECPWGSDQHDSIGGMRHLDCGDIEILVFQSADEVAIPDYTAGEEFHAYQADNFLIGAYDRRNLDKALEGMSE